MAKTATRRMIVHRVMNVTPFPYWAGGWCHHRKACMVLARILGYQLDHDALQRVLGPEYEWRDNMSRCVVCREWINKES